ncbi:MAG: Rieske 2Fe-2S domain-containing protein [Chlorobi bacterium]|nr:Rieske 2Fe-2S domain-containing protein [Chlorobiota bacterium]
MNKTEKITRRSLLRKIAGIISLPMIAFWMKGIDRTKATSARTKITLPNDLSEGITFLDKVIIRKNGKNVKVFSSSCTHLGCKINSEAEDELICPCHGSKFSFDGNPIVGPAVKPLKQLELHKDKKSGEVIVYV